MPRKKYTEGQDSPCSEGAGERSEGGGSLPEAWGLRGYGLQLTKEVRRDEHP
jgi:hypothetical protein